VAEACNKIYIKGPMLKYKANKRKVGKKKQRKWKIERIEKKKKNLCGLSPQAN
jgi:hypothetical protein